MAQHNLKTVQPYFESFGWEKRTLNAEGMIEALKKEICSYWKNISPKRSNILIVKFVPL